MNKMKEVAALLGVELLEEFKLRDITKNDPQEELYRFTETDVEYKRSGDEWNSSLYLTYMLNGELEIVKLPWKPKDGDIYFMASEECVYRYVFCNSMFHFKNYITGNYFRTEEEARTNADRIRAKLIKMYDDGVQI